MSSESVTVCPLDFTWIQGFRNRGPQPYDLPG